jgi:glucose-6-phosphate dehydrogenase assembly protein OpcA
MAPDVAAIERIDGQSVPVDPAQVEAEFARIWRETAAKGFDASSIRLRVLNLVGFGEIGDAVTRFEAAMQIMPVRHPCRGILAITDPEAVDLTAALSAHCWRSRGGGRYVCCEEVLLRAGPDDEARLASGVLGLLVAELPVVAWLMDAPDASSYLATEILEAADRVLFDSGRGADAGAGLAAMLRIADEHDLRVLDLAWGRLITWRELVAQFFDNPRGLEHVDSVRSLSVRWGASGRADALLLAGWLASRLGMAVADVAPDGDSFSATLYDATRAVTLRVDRHQGCAAGVCAATMEMDGVSLELARAASGRVSVIERWREGPTERMVEVAPEDEPATVARMLDEGADDAYSEAARSALALLAG